MKRKSLVLLLFLTHFFTGLFVISSINSSLPQTTIEQNVDTSLEGLVLGNVEDVKNPPFPPTDLTFLDGAIWMGCDSDTNLYKINPMTGQEITHINFGFKISGVTTDGTYLYLSVREDIFNNGTILKVQTDGTIVSTLNVPLNYWCYWGLAWDGSRLWASHSPKTLLRINPNSGVVELNLTTDLTVSGLTWYNGDLWGISHSTDEVWAFDPATGRTKEVFDGPTTGSGDWGLAFNGTHFLTTNYLTDSIYFLDIPTAIGEVWNQHPSLCLDTGDLGWNGTHYFVADWLQMKINILHDGTFEKVGEISVGFNPLALTVVDNYIYVSRDSSPWQIYKYTTGGSFIASYASIGVGISGLAYDGTYLWATDDNKNLYKLNLADCTEIEKYTTPETYFGLTYDWKNKVIWAVDRDINRIVQVSTADGQQTGIMVPTPTTSTEFGLAFNGEHLIYTDFGANIIYKIIIQLPAGGIPGFTDIYIFLSIIVLASVSLILKQQKEHLINI